MYGYINDTDQGWQSVQNNLDINIRKKSTNFDFKILKSQKKSMVFRLRIPDIVI